MDYQRWSNDLANVLLSLFPLILRPNASSDSICPLSCRTLQPIGYFNLAKIQGMPVILSMFIKVSLYPKELLRTTCGTERFAPSITCIKPKPATIRMAIPNSMTAAFAGDFLRCFTRLFNIVASKCRGVSARLLRISSLILLGTRIRFLLAGWTVLPLDTEGTGINLALHFVHCIDVDMSKYSRY